jgi:hypothetical protein
MARKIPVARLDGMSNGSSNHPHGVLVEIVDDPSLLFGLQITVTGGADGKKRHASALIDLDSLEAAIRDARARRDSMS